MSHPNQEFSEFRFSWSPTCFVYFQILAEDFEYRGSSEVSTSYIRAITLFIAQLEDIHKFYTKKYNEELFCE